MEIILLLKAIFLGIVQGLGEFLPISSTGHLIIFEKLLNFSQEDFGLTFDAALHLGTLLALFWFFTDDIFKLLGGTLQAIKERRTNKESKMMVLLAVGTLPAALLGLTLESKIETSFRSPILVALMLISFSLVIWLTEKRSAQKEEMASLKSSGAFLVGLFQSLALIPGVSRSGASIVGGLLIKLKEEEAARFSFLLSIPIVLGAGLKKILDLQGSTSLAGDIPYYLGGFLAAALTGFFAIKYFLAFLKKHKLTAFIAYRIALGILVILLYLWGKI